MNRREQTALAALALGFVGAIAVSSNAVSIIKDSREKRKRIKAWSRETSACVKNAKKRCMELANDPNATANDVLEAWAWEAKFLDIMQNRPID